MDLISFINKFLERHDEILVDENNLRNFLYKEEKETSRKLYKKLWVYQKRFFETCEGVRLRNLIYLNSKFNNYIAHLDYYVIEYINNLNFLIYQSMDLLNFKNFFEKKLEKVSTKEECCICYENYENFKCQQCVFFCCSNCWAKNGQNCPMCRYFIIF